MAGTLTVTRTDLLEKAVQGMNPNVVGELVSVAWTSTAGGAADISVELKGWIVKAITDPASGGSAPTDNYDITLLRNGLDILDGCLLNRDTANTEQVPTANSGISVITYANGTYTFTVANAGDTKGGVCEFYVYI